MVTVRAIVSEVLVAVILYCGVIITVIILVPSRKMTCIAVPGPNSLCTARMIQEGIVVTLTAKSGCCIIDHFLDVALFNDSLSKYLVRERISELIGI